LQPSPELPLQHTTLTILANLTPLQLQPNVQYATFTTLAIITTIANSANLATKITKRLSESPV